MNTISILRSSDSIVDIFVISKLFCVEMVQADTDCIGKLSRCLLKSEDVDLWRNIVANPHVLPDGLTAGEAVLNQCLADLMKEGTSSGTVEILAKNDCALWFYLFHPLKVVYPYFASNFIETLLTLEAKYENKEKVLK